jgi:drug/metabolite transporter (DMT)-like permease
MGVTGVAVYQFLENCAIYYTNASTVAIPVSFGPVVTALFARFLSRDRSLSVPFAAGAVVATVGVALVSLNGVMALDLRPLGDFMALGAMASWGLYSVLVDKANARGCPQAEAIRRAFFWSLVISAPLAFRGATEQGYYALDGSFSVTLDADANAERFARPLNCVNLGFL